MSGGDDASAPAPDAAAIRIRDAREGDAADWARMRSALWDEDHERVIAAFFAGARHDCEKVLVAKRDDGSIAGFIELSVRSHAEGCATSPVAYIEGWYVDADLRRSGVGGALVEAAEEWAVAAGYGEIASDCVIDNEVGYAAHLRLGYTETDRIICFRKELERT